MSLHQEPIPSLCLFAVIIDEPTTSIQNKKGTVLYLFADNMKFYEKSTRFNSLFDLQRKMLKDKGL